MRVTRYHTNPIIRPDMDDRMGQNINGPSLIRAPDWIEDRLGTYYLYFGHHQGRYIRLAYADRLVEGPWTVHGPGVLPQEESLFEGHIASPDVHVDHERREIRMYYHGGLPEGDQGTRVAVSQDGLDFTPLPQVLGAPYFRVFQWQGFHYAIGMPGRLYRSRNGRTNFEEGQCILPESARHCAVLIDGARLNIFYSAIGDCPERILLSTIDLTRDWTAWRSSEAVTVIEPEMKYEGAGLPLKPSIMGWAPEPVRQLRDPAICEENGRTYLLYSVAGEHGIAISEMIG